VTAGQSKPRESHERGKATPIDSRVGGSHATAKFQQARFCGLSRLGRFNDGAIASGIELISI
jgi:hypothetical protein